LIGQFQLDEEAIEAEAFRLYSEDLERLDRMLTLAEAWRHKSRAESHKGVKIQLGIGEFSQFWQNEPKFGVSFQIFGFWATLRLCVRVCWAPFRPFFIDGSFAEYDRIVVRKGGEP
jgi:hypothetical protein